MQCLQQRHLVLSCQGVRMQGELLLERAEARSTPASLRARFRKQARSFPEPTKTADPPVGLPSTI